MTKHSTTMHLFSRLPSSCPFYIDQPYSLASFAPFLLYSLALFTLFIYLFYSICFDFEGKVIALNFLLKPACSADQSDMFFLINAKQQQQQQNIVTVPLVYNFLCISFIFVVLYTKISSHTQPFPIVIYKRVINLNNLPSCLTFCKLIM